VSFAFITLSVASQQVFIVVSVYFVIGSVWNLLDTPLYSEIIMRNVDQHIVQYKVKMRHLGTLSR
jgi:hypothetical protein